MGVDYARINRRLSLLLAGMVIIFPFRSKVFCEDFAWERVGILDASGVDSSGGVYFPLCLGVESLGDGLEGCWMTFTSVQEAGRHLPSGWQFPLIEAKAVKSSETDVKVWFPDGSKQIFQIGPEGEGLVGNAAWEGKIERNVVSIESKNSGRSFRFENGRLNSMVDGDGNDWKWDYGDSVTEVLTPRGMLTFSRAGSGVDSRVAVKFPSGGEATVDFSELGEIDEGLLAERGYYTGLDTVVSLEGARIVFESGEDNGLRNLLVNSSDIGLRKRFSWNSSTGRLLVVDDYDVLIGDLDDGMMGQASITLRSRKDGEMKVIHPGSYGSKSMVATANADGSAIEDYFVFGQNGEKLLRERVFVDTEGSRHVMHKASYSEEGLVLRAQGGGFERRLLEGGDIGIFRDNKLIRRYEKNE